MNVVWNPGMLTASRSSRVEASMSTSQKALREAAEEMESLFLYQLLEEMRRTVPESSLFGDRKAEKLFESLLDQEMTQDIARTQGLGLSTLIYEQMAKHVADDD